MNLSILLLTIGLGVTFVLQWLDRKYYFKLLLAAVDYGHLFESENDNIKLIYGAYGGLTSYISEKVSRSESKRAAKIFYYISFFAIVSIILAMIWVLNKDFWFR